MKRFVSIAALLCTLSSARAEETPGEVAILVAKRDLAAGATLTAADFEAVKVAERWVTSSYVKEDSAQSIIKASLLRPVLKGDPLLWIWFEAANVRDASCSSLFPEEGAEGAEKAVARHRAAVLDHR